MSEKFVIRMANAEDTQDVMALMREFAANMDKTDKLELTEEKLRESVFEKGYAKVLVSQLDGYTIGFALYYPTYSSFAGKAAMYLEDIYITPLFRGKGYGKEMMKVLNEIAEKEGFFRIEWKVLKWNRKAIDFYHSIGAELENENMTFMLLTNKHMFA